MAKDLDAMLKLMLRAKQDPKLAGALEKLGALLDSPDGETLARALAGGGSDALKTAADAMLRGDKAGARAAMTRLLSTREGAAAATRLADLISRG